MLFRALHAILLGTALACVAFGTAAAQEVLLPRAYEQTSVGIVYDRELSFPVTLHTNGFELGVHWGRLRSYYKTRYWSLGVGHVKHPAEIKQSSGGSPSGSFRQGAASFVYGKQRNLYPVRLARGFRRYYSGKDRRRGVAVGLDYELGGLLGVSKAYTLQASQTGDNVSNPDRFISYDERPSLFVDRGRIEGAGGLRRGWSEARFHPGVTAKLGVHLDWGAFDEFMRAIEVGVLVDAYASSVPLLVDEADARNTPLFVNFYATLQLGRRR